MEKQSEINAKNNQLQELVRNQNDLNRQGKPKMPLVHYEWKPEYEQSAKIAIEEDNQLQTEEQYIKGEHESKNIWNKFYKHHQNKYFHPRNYLNRELPELVSVQNEPNKDKTYVLSELGCGVGDTIFPLADEYPNIKFQCCDLSDTAITCLKQHPKYNEQIINAQVCDLVTEPLPITFQQPHITTLIFCLSAISPSQYDSVALKIYQSMAPGGVLYFRDYGLYDHQQVNLSKKKGRKLQENFYLKGDGIRVYYFEKEETRKIFEKVGFETLECKMCLRYLENRKKGIEMYRVWIQGRFKKPGPDLFGELNLQKNDDQTDEIIKELQKFNENEEIKQDQ